MASRWMAPKLAKMARDRGDHNPSNADAMPVARPRAGHTIETSNRLTAEAATLVAEYTGVVTVLDAGRDMVRQGKGKRQINAPFMIERMYGRHDKSPTRKALELAVQMTDAWGTSDRLIRNGAVVG